MVEDLTELDTRAAMRGGSPLNELDLIGKLGIDLDDRFSAMEAVSGPQPPPSDGEKSEDPLDRVNEANLALKNRITKKLDNEKLSTTCGLTAENVLNRAGVLSCGGCHQFSFFEGASNSRPRLIAPGIVWPKSQGFVQINERGALSEALTDWFLPFRRKNLEGFLSGAQPFMIIEDEELRQTVTSGLQPLDVLLANGTMSDADRGEALRQLRENVQALRRVDNRTPGAFVSRRRSH
jgi:hypothetical protein